METYKVEAMGYRCTPRPDLSAWAMETGIDPGHDALLDAIRAERGEAIDPARLADLFAADALADTAAANAELAAVDEADLHAEYDALGKRLQAAQIASRDADLGHQQALEAAVALRRELGLILTASGYRTRTQIRSAAEVAQRTARTLAGEMPSRGEVIPALHAFRHDITADPNRAACEDCGHPHNHPSHGSAR